MSLAINLEYQPYVPLFRRLSDALRRAILEGRLRNGDALPSTRELSTTMKISRATVLKAFDDLETQGLVRSRPGKGLFVSYEPSVEITFEERLPVQKTVQFSAYAQRVIALRDYKSIVHLPATNFGGPPADLSPLHEWRQLLFRYCRRSFLSESSELSQISDEMEPFGFEPLRQALAAYLHRARAVRSTADQIAVFSTKQARLELIARILLDEGDLVAFEEPGYPEARHLFSSHGARVLNVPVEADGIDVDWLMEKQLPIKFVYVTPSHQDPTGITMSMEKRLKLLDWARSNGAYIIEDDYDCEYNYGKQSMPSLMGLDRHDSVIYLASLWKVLYQVNRFGIVVLPQSLTPAAVQAKLHMERHLPLLEQLVLTDFINEGLLERHIRRTQQRLAKRRQIIIHALSKHMQTFLTVPKEAAGMHLIVKFFEGVSETDIESSAHECGVTLTGTSAYYALENRCHREYMLPFAGIDEAATEEAISNWAVRLKGLQR